MFNKTVLLLIFCAIVSAKDIIINEYPLALIYGVPPLVDSFEQRSCNFIINHSSNSISGNNRNNNFNFDGETTSLNLFYHQNLKYSIIDGFSLANSFYIHSEGFLDDFILNWHNLWGFPQGNRPFVKNNQIDYHLNFKNQTVYKINSTQYGFGDLYFFTHTNLIFKYLQLSISPGISTPLIKSKKFTNSTRSKIHLQFSLKNCSLLKKYSGEIIFHQGFTYNLENDKTIDFTNFLNYGAIESNFFINDNFEIGVGIKYHSKLLQNSNFFQLNQGTLAINIMLNHKISDLFMWGILFQEDFLVDTNCDMSAGLNFSYQFISKNK